MIKRGKNINLFLMDGSATGRIKCTLANWTGLSFKIPRTELTKCKDRDDLKQGGVYFLFGIDEETDKEVVYVGQAGMRKNGEGILNRLFEHKRNPEKIIGLKQLFSQLRIILLVQQKLVILNQGFMKWLKMLVGILSIILMNPISEI